MQRERTAIRIPSIGLAGSAGEGGRAATAFAPGDLSPRSICTSWLAMQCQLIGNVRGAIVLLERAGGGELVPVAALRPDELPAPDEELRRAAEEAFAARARRVVARRSRGPGAEAIHDLSLPILSPNGALGAVTLRVAGLEDAEQGWTIGQLERSAGWLASLLSVSRSLRLESPATAPPPAAPANANVTAADAGLRTVLDLVATVVQEESAQAAANAFTTELAVRLECHRASLGLSRGGPVEAFSISHLAAPDGSTSIVRAIEAAMDEAQDQDEVVEFVRSRREADDTFQITLRHAELSREPSSQSVLSVPFRAGEGARGVLTLERSSSGGFEPGVVELCRAALGLAVPFLHLKRQDERALPSKALDAATRTARDFLGPRGLRWKLAGIVLVGAAIFSCIARGEYRITANACLEGSVQRAVVAPFDGYIAAAEHRAGDAVRANDLLCRLEDRDLELELRKWQGQEEQLSKRHQQALAQRNAAQVKIFAAQRREAQAQLALVEDRLARTRIVAPTDGIIVTGDLTQSIGAPVQRGDVLFEVSPGDIDRVVLKVDERSLAAVAPMQSGSLVLKAFPGEPRSFRVERITPVASPSDGRNCFRVDGRLDGPPDPRIRPGMEGVGKIDIDRRPLAAIWTRDLVDWLRLTLWSWAP